MHMRTLVTGGSGFIGVHVVTHLLARGWEVANVDIVPPPDGAARANWRNCSITDREALLKVVREFQPQCIVHMAAYASMEATSLAEFRANTYGTANVLTAAGETASVERIIITSSQHVRKPGSGQPASDTDFVPYMFYGESKVITEQLTRAADLPCVWTIIRPTAVWGPGHRLLADGLWRQMIMGRYFHPKDDPVLRSYGYVKNLAWQIEGLLRAERSLVNKKVFYIADGNGLQREWVNAVSRELTGHEARSVPLWLLRVLAKFGDGLRACGLRFPLYDSRLMNLITPNPVPVDPILKLLGTPPYTLEQGAKETAEWLKHYYQGAAK